MSKFSFHPFDFFFCVCLFLTPTSKSKIWLIRILNFNVLSITYFKTCCRHLSFDNSIWVDRINNIHCLVLLEHSWVSHQTHNGCSVWKSNLDFIIVSMFHDLLDETFCFVNNSWGPAVIDINFFNWWSSLDLALYDLIHWCIWSIHESIFLLYFTQGFECFVKIFHIGDDAPIEFKEWKIHLEKTIKQSCSIYFLMVENKSDILLIYIRKFSLPLLSWNKFFLLLEHFFFCLNILPWEWDNYRKENIANWFPIIFLRLFFKFMTIYTSV